MEQLGTLLGLFMWSVAALMVAAAGILIYQTIMGLYDWIQYKREVNRFARKVLQDRRYRH